MNRDRMEPGGSRRSGTWARAATSIGKGQRQAGVPPVADMPPSPAATTNSQEPVKGRHSGRWLLAAFCIYALVALAANWPAFPGDPGILRQGDLTQKAWFLAWTPHAVYDLQNPFYTTWLNFPTGIDLLQNTQVALLGILTAPLTLVAGPVASINLLLWLAFPLSAGAMFVLARRWVASPLAALAAGALYGFSPYMIAESTAHLSLAFVPLPPLIFLALGEAIAGRRRWGAVLGMLIVAQFFISAEVLATTAIVAAIAIIVVAAMRPRTVRAAVRHGLAPIALAFSIAAVCLSYPVWVMVAGPYHYSGSAFAGGLSADLLGVIVPTSSQLVVPSGVAAFGDKLLGGNVIENGSYLGVPMLVLLTMLVGRFRRSIRMRFCAVMLLVCFVLSLGPRLIVNNVDTGFPLPFALLQNAPLLGSMLAVRISLYVDLFAALMVGIDLDCVIRGRPRRALGGRDGAGPEARAHTGTVKRRIWWAVVGLAAAVTVVGWIPRWPYATAPAGVPPFFSSSAIDNIPAGSVALISPYPSVEEVQPMLWQAVARMRFRIVGGYGLFADSTGGFSDFPAVLGPAAVERFLWSTVTGGLPYPAGPVPRYGAKLIALTRVFMQSNHIGTVLWTPIGTYPTVVRQLFVAVLGSPSQVSGGVDAWYGVQSILARAGR